MHKIKRHIPLMLIVAALLLPGCSAKKNTATSRFWQAFTTRYNVYYHGKTNYDEQLQEMLSTYEDDYSQHVFIHPAEARNYPKAPQPTGSFDRTIEKMQKAIALHSIKKKPKKKAGKSSDPKYREWMKRDEYNPFLHNAWFTLAQAQYMKGDFLNAAATFRYITRHFLWKPYLVQESQIWEALSYCAMGWTTEADNVLAHVHIDKITNKRIRSLANLAWADYYIKDRRNEQAIPYLAQAVKGAKGGQKVRLNFLLGQLYEETQQYDLAYRAFKNAGSSSGSTYRTKFNARIKQSAVYRGVNITSEVRALKRMTRYDRNKPYLDQIYYAIGNLYLSRGDTTHAIENYVQAAKKSTRNGIDKAISQLTLGAVYFAQHKYDLAQPCYAEALPQISEDYPNYKLLKHRSDVLDELAVYSGNVTLQDSLLKLSKMTPEEQKKVIKKIIDELKKKEKEEKEAAARETYLADQAAKGNALGAKGNAPATYQINDDKSWYFYNSATVNAGKTAFQQLWGSRKLEDNWRRRNKATYALTDDDLDDDNLPNDSTSAVSADSTKVDKETAKRENDPHFEEYYLKQIPKTEEQIQAANDVIQEGLYNMGVILKDKLDDFDASATEFNHLLSRYPDNTYRLDVYYNMYLLYMRKGDPATAERYRDYILTDFADSKYGQAMQDPLYLDNLKNMPYEEQILYEQAYADYLNNDNEGVHAAYDLMMEKYPLSKIMPKFMFIDALSYVTEHNYDKFKETLKDLLQRYPETDITSTASSIVKQLNQGRKLEGGGSNARGMIWSVRLSNDTTPEALEKKFTPFKEDNDKPQVFILLYPTDTVSSNLLLYEVARHNFNSFVVKDYDLEQMNFGRLGLLVVKGFADFAEVTHYRTIFEQDETLVIPPQVHIVLISESNFSLLLNEGRSFEDYFNYLEEQNDKKHKKLEGSESKDKSDDDNITESDSLALNTDSLTLKTDSLTLSSDSLALADSTATTKKAVEKSVRDTKKAQRDAEKAKKAQEKAKKEAEEKAKKDAEAKRIADQKAAEAAAKHEAEQARKAELKRQRAETAKRKADEARRKAEQERNNSGGSTTGGGSSSIGDGGRTGATTQTVPDTSKSVTDTDAGTTTTDTDRRSVRDTKQQSKADKKAQEQRERELQKQREREEKAREKAENEHLKQLEREAKEKEKAEMKRYKQQQDSIKKEEKAQYKARRLAELAREDSIEQAMLDHERMMDNARKSREDSVKNARKQKEQALKQAKKEKEQARKQRERERKEQLKQKERERKQKAEERKRKQKEREQERKAKQKEREQERKAKQKEAQERQKIRQEEAKAARDAAKAEKEAKAKAKADSDKKSTTKRAETKTGSNKSGGTEATRSVKDKKNKD
ncbi:MAG: hypothetical protein IJ632_04090 [Muribaculaceae bacterium]|nr:hypothetical protein [Muribaculaceae bacterium]